MEKIFCKSELEFLELDMKYDLEDCGMSGLYPGYRWYQDSGANIAVYRKRGEYNDL